MVCGLPLPLLALSLCSLPYSLINAQQSQMTLSLNTILPMTLNSTSPSPMSLSLPPSSPDSPISVSISLCSATQPFPKFFVSTDSNQNGANGGGAAQLSFDEGIGVWSGSTGVAGRLVIYLGDGASSVQGGIWSFEVAVSNGAPLHRDLLIPPLLGDTTATQALLFSPPFAPPNHTSPTYPNYTLPGGNISLPDQPPLSAQTNASLILAPTNQLKQQSSANLSRSACAIKAAASNIGGAWIRTNGTGGVNGSTSLVLRDKDGWRSQWIIEGLTANTNYTAWVVQDGGALAGPIYAFTKSSSFTCPLVHSLPFCPSTSYAVPLPPTPDGTTSYSSSNLPSNISEPLISSLSNFTTALLTFACGREIFSPLQTCETCADAYRTWACAVSLPRCGEIPSPLASSLSAQPTPSKGSKAHTLPTPAILSHPQAPSRLQDISAYDELLPCIETCQAVDRACPPLFGWACPHASVNANWSYGVGFIDGWDGMQGKGVPGVAQDQWGVGWCNG